MGVLITSLLEIKPDVNLARRPVTNLNQYSLSLSPPSPVVKHEPISTPRYQQSPRAQRLLTSMSVDANRGINIGSLARCADPISITAFTFPRTLSRL